MFKFVICSVGLITILSLFTSSQAIAQNTVGSCSDDWERAFEPDPELYPFASNCFEHELGTLHYVDEGDSDSDHTILFVHGNPSWSILHQGPMIAMVEAGHRVLSLDMLGFGLSDKPSSDDFGYRPRDHSAILEEWVVALDLQNVTLVVHDWGGPMGLGMAGRQPDRVANMVITNTWAWDLPEDDTDGLYHALINWGNTALEVGDALTESCLITRNNAQGIALAYDLDQGELYDRVLKTYRAAWFNPETGAALWPEICEPTVIYAQSILGDPEFLKEVEAGLANLIGKPYALVTGRADTLFGELHYIEDGETRCPEGTTPVCDPDMLWPGSSCDADFSAGNGLLNVDLTSIPTFALDNAALGAARTSLEAYVCRVDGEPVLPYVDRFIGLLGEEHLVSLYTPAFPRHFIAAYPEGQASIENAIVDLLTIGED
jgi:haloalkane dehalogenase